MEELGDLHRLGFREFRDFRGSHIMGFATGVKLKYRFMLEMANWFGNFWLNNDFCHFPYPFGIWNLVPL